MRRLNWAEPVKGAAILMVVVFHVSLYLASTGVDVVMGRLKVPLELIPMPAFFLLAGMTAASHPGLPLRSVWWRRVWPIAYVYLLWSLLRGAFYLVVPGLQGGLGDLPADDWRTILLLPFWPSSSYWFLWALALFTLVRRLVARVPAWIQLTVSGALSAVVSAGWLTVDNVGWTRFAQLLVFFLAGALLGSRVKQFVDRSRLRDVAVVGVLFALVAAAAALGLRPLPPVVLVAQVLAVAFTVLVLAHLPAGRVRSGLTSLGNQSFRIYLIHLFPIVLLAAALGLLDPTWGKPVGVALQVLGTVLVVGVTLRIARATNGARWLYAPPDRLLPKRAAAGNRSVPRTREVSAPTER